VTEKFEQEKAAFFVTLFVYVSGGLRIPQEIRRGQHTVFSMKQTLAYIMLLLFIKIVISISIK